MLEDSVVTVGDGFSVTDVRCPGSHPGFDAPEEERGHVLVAMRRGALKMSAG